MKTGNLLDYNKCVESWELQQNAHIKNREDRFQFMFEMVEQVCGTKPTILDLACGPGSLSGRFLQRFPNGKSVAVDYDPVLLAIARNYASYDHSRVTFVEANLASLDWALKLPKKKFDAVLSTTALHWLPDKSLRKLYSKIFTLLGPDGVFLNGDHIYPESEPKKLKDIFTKIRHSFEETRFSKGDALEWCEWWKHLTNYEELEGLLEERGRRYPNSDNHNHHISLEKHKLYLENAGFLDVGVGWQDMDNRVLIALK